MQSGGQKSVLKFGLASVCVCMCVWVRYVCSFSSYEAVVTFVLGSSSGHLIFSFLYFCYKKAGN